MHETIEESINTIKPEVTSLRKLESESITDYIIRTENIINGPKEAGEVISDGLLFLKRLPPNSKPFTIVITLWN